MLVEVLYFSSVKPLQVEVGSSLSGEKASPSPAPISHGERNIPMFEGRVVLHDRTVRRGPRRIQGFFSKHPLLCPASSHLTNDFRFQKVCITSQVCCGPRLTRRCFFRRH